MFVYCFVMLSLLALYVCVGNVGLWFCNVVVALYCMCVWVGM